MPSAATQKARHNALLRYRSPDDPVVVEARRDLRAARAEDYIKQLVDGFPPLTDSQKIKLAGLLRPTSGTAA